jgi:hypothetical protein
MVYTIRKWSFGIFIKFFQKIHLKSKPVMRTLKFKLFVVLLLIVHFMPLQATVRTVSNDPARPAQFTTIEAAINGASPGDTLRIAGSSNEYMLPPTLFFNLTFIGEGANNPNGQSTIFTRESPYSFTLGRLNSSLGSSGSSFHGIRFHPNVGIFLDPLFSGGTLATQTLDNIRFERCQFNGVQIASGTTKQISNVLFRNCLFNSGSISVSGSFISNILITNCIFNPGSISGGSAPLNGNLLIRNCLFLNHTASRFVSISGVIVENCIFYKSEPTGAINSVFNNNITYLCNSNTIPYGTNAGSGNLINVNPLFMNYPALGANFEWTHNYGLQAGSPAIGTGSNGTNIGLTGGNAPFNNIPGNSRIPVVTGLTLPTSSVPVGGTLEINIQAISRN